MRRRKKMRVNTGFKRLAVHIPWLILAVVMLLFCIPHSVNAASTKKYTLVRGETKQLKKRPGAVWSSKNAAVASVTQTGLVTAKRRGKTTITSKVGSKKYKFKITVEKPAFSKKTVKLALNKTKVIKITGTTRKFSFVSSDPSVVEVKKKAKNKVRIKALKDGTATVGAVYHGVMLTCVVTAGSGNAAQVDPDADDTAAKDKSSIEIKGYDGKVLQTLTYKKSSIAKSVSAVSSYGQSAPLYTSVNGGDGLENIYSDKNTGKVHIPNVKLSDKEVNGTIAKACAWARAVCNSKYHGYDNGQSKDKGRNRYTWGIPKKDSPGTGDYCCYSLAICAYYFAGVNMLGEGLGVGEPVFYPPKSPQWLKSGGVFFYGDRNYVGTSPYDCRNYYPKLGFTDITQQVKKAGKKFVYKAGDIAVAYKTHQHAQLIIKDGTAKKCEVAEACGPGKGKKKGGDQSGSELCVYNHLYNPKEINRVYRFTGEGVILNKAGLTG